MHLQRVQSYLNNYQESLGFPSVRIHFLSTLAEYLDQYPLQFAQEQVTCLEWRYVEYLIEGHQMWGTCDSFRNAYQCVHKEGEIR